VTAGQARVAGFLALVHGIGLRLDSTWQGTALVLIVGGLVLTLAALAREASVSGPGEG
jgi:hypothetical protein